LGEWKGVRTVDSDTMIVRTALSPPFNSVPCQDSIHLPLFFSYSNGKSIETLHVWYI
jgi:hypothetical protein